jgi:hypothetical protein
VPKSEVSLFPQQVKTIKWLARIQTLDRDEHGGQQLLTGAAACVSKL